VHRSRMGVKQNSTPSRRELLLQVGEAVAEGEMQSKLDKAN